MSDLVGEIDIILHENKQLREQNRVLRGLLEEIVHDCEHVGSIQHFDKAERRTWVSVANRIKAALTATSQEEEHESR